MTKQITYYDFQVIGVGGAGCNAVDSIVSRTTGETFHQLLGQMQFIAVNTDIQAIANSCALNKIQLGPELTKGMGAGGNPFIGREAALESNDVIKNTINKNLHKHETNRNNTGAYLSYEKRKILFIMAGMGGGTGTGASPVIAEIAKKSGMFIISIVTTPFDYEGEVRMNTAIDGIDSLRRHSDAVITISNQKVLSAFNTIEANKTVPLNTNNVNTVEETGSLQSLFTYTNDVIFWTIVGIANIILKPGIINVDLADICSLLSEPGDTCVTIGRAKGSDKTLKATMQAINSPLLEQLTYTSRTPNSEQLPATRSRASGILLNITTGEQLNINELKSIFNTIKTITDKQCNIILGFSQDKNLKDELILTLIATGLNDEKQKSIVKERRLRIPAFKRNLYNYHIPGK